MLNKNILFREVQRLPYFWFVNFCALCLAGVFWWGFIQQIVYGHPFGDKPMPDWLFVLFVLVMGILFPIAVYKSKLITEIREDGLYIRLIPFHIRFIHFPIDYIRNVKTITYNSLLRFGGYGIRYNFHGERAYNLRGKEGIEFYAEGKTIVIGSQQSVELEKALKSVMFTDI